LYPSRRLPLALDWILLIAALLVFLPPVTFTLLRERESRLALELYEPFSRPSFDLSFPKTTAYDPLSFVGRGRQAGFWEWSPEGLTLTEKGRRFFADTPTSISGSVTAGRRRVTSIGTVEDRGGNREVKFLYVWMEVSEPAAVLLDHAPTAGAGYEGRAVLAKESGVWRAKSLNLPEYDKPLARLLDESQGVKR